MKKYFSPGRINLIGEHIDYSGGNVFPCAIDLGTKGEVTLNDSNLIRLNSKNVSSSKVIEVDFTKEYKKTNTWADYMIGVLDTLRNHGYENKIGFDLTIDSNLPHGAGLSSSACIEVLMCVILNDLNNFNLSDEQIALFAQEAENIFVGVNCGIMDQFIIANGKKDNALLLNTSTLKFDLTEVKLENYIIVILNSNKQRGLVDSAYNERREQCSISTQIVKDHYNVENLCDISVAELVAIKDKFDPIVYKRAFHAVSEQERVANAFKALQENDILKFADYVTQTHYSMRDNFEVSCDELDFLVDKSLEYGAIGARIVGAGFGGCGIAIINKDTFDTFSAKLKQDYRVKFNINCDVYNVNIVDKCMLVGEVNE